MPGAAARAPSLTPRRTPAANLRSVNVASGFGCAPVSQSSKRGGTWVSCGQDAAELGEHVEQAGVEAGGFYRIADGLIAEEWICSNMATLLRQVG